MNYSLSSRIKRAETEVLAVHCGDYRFQEAFYEFLNGSLKLDGNYDLMVIPGVGRILQTCRTGQILVQRTDLIIQNR